MAKKARALADLLKLISDFPTGRTTRQIYRLMGVERSQKEKNEVQKTLHTLLQDDLIELTRDHRWIARSRRPSPTIAPEATPRRQGALESTEQLSAAPARFRQTLLDVVEDTANSDQSGIDPSALLRYYKAALRSDPRGAIAQVVDRHGQQFQLISGSGNWWPEGERTGEIRARLADLPDSFREALTRREAEEQAVAVGWPLAVARQRGVATIVPVGLVAATWKRNETELILTLEQDDVMVNPEWISVAARGAGWTKATLSEVFSTPGAVGLPRQDFRARLREVAARSIRGALQGTQTAAQLDMDAEGIHDALALFLPSESSFTAGAVRDLDVIATWSHDRLATTALAPFLGIMSQADTPAIAALNTGPLNAEQIEAVTHAGHTPLTVVTGPPGTGKSQAIVAMTASSLAAGQSVLVASKNHQALDAVEDRLGGIASDIEFLVRTLNPAKEIDRDTRDVLDEITNTTKRPGLPADDAIQFEIEDLATRRREALLTLSRKRQLHTDLSQYLDRQRAIETARNTRGETTTARPEPKVPLLRRLMYWLKSLFGKTDVKASKSDALTLRDVSREIRDIRSELAKLPQAEDPAALTDRLAALVPGWLERRLAHQCCVDESTAATLKSHLADLILEGEKKLDRSLTETVVAHRPLWLASVLGTPKRIGLHDALFDLVIFDEASQCDIASALPLLARAKRAVVVGDAKQLSFVPGLGVAQDRNLMAAQGLPSKGMGRFAQGRQSLFDLADASTGAQKVILRDQYRSAEAIVSYINNDFYQGKLRVSGDQDGLRPPRNMRPGLAWTDVPARTPINGGNVNTAEVQAIAQHVQHLLAEQDYQGSIGVISPFRDQVSKLNGALKVAVSEELRKKADLRVGTVDAFQGQERDLILFSPVVHAGSKPSNITFYQRDYRRMNVAISRARAVAHVFGDKQFARSGKVTRLTSLLDRIENPPASGGEGVFDSHWERIVDAALRRRGFDYAPQYHIAGRRLDFAVFGADGTRLDLEVDGRIWHQDSDGNRKLDDIFRDHQMKALGWKVRRFWVDELQQDLEGCIDLVEEDLRG